MTQTAEPTQRAGLELAHAAAMPAPQGGALPTGLEWQALERMANTLAASSVIPYRLKGKPADVAVILLAAREYGIPPLMALSKLPVVNGTPAPMGELMVALVFRAGHYIAADFRNPDGSLYGGGPLLPGHYGECRYRRSDWTEEHSLRFTVAEAIQANLLRLAPDGSPRARDSKDQATPWESYTPNMARWRAVANACRLAFADVLMGLSYLPEEKGAIVDADGAPVQGEVVEPRVAPQGSLEQRQAQETADRLRDFAGPVETLRNVLQHAIDNGYDDQLVTPPAGGEATPLCQVLRAAIRAAEETVDGEVVEDAPAATQEPAQGAQEATREPVQGAGEVQVPQGWSDDGNDDRLIADVLTALEAAQTIDDARAVWRMSGPVRGVEIDDVTHGRRTIGQLIMARQKDLAEQ